MFILKEIFAIPLDKLEEMPAVKESLILDLNTQNLNHANQYK